MTFAGINYLAVLVAAAAGWGVGMPWYMALARPWMAANGLSPEAMEACKRRPGAALPFVFAALACVVMAWALAGLIGPIGAMTLRGGAISGLFCWAGFVLTTMLVNNSFAMRRPLLLAIDGGYWLVVLALMGGIIGTMGV